MSPSTADYRRWLLDDAALLRAAAASSPQATVATCPGWTARDVVDHVGEVYAHKVAVLRLGRAPVEGEWPWAPEDDSVFAWYDERLAELVRELDSRDGDDLSWTFIAADQTVGFWWRRMAHETAIHRVDAELAVGRAPCAHDELQAVDGVAELLGFAGDPSVLDQPTSSIGANGTVMVDAGGSRLLVTMSDAGQSLAPAGSSTIADAYIEAAAPDLYRWLWNRPPEGPITQDGNSAVLRRLKARLAVGMD